jgi:predicted nucleotidyltransferase
VSQATDTQRALATRLADALDADARVDSAWLAGSFGRGEADPWSDIDVIALVDPEDRAACLAEYAGAHNPVGETVLLLTLYGRIVHAVRPDWERYDIHFVTPDEFRTVDKLRLKPLAPESLDGPPSVEVTWGSYEPSAEDVVGMTEEFLRIQGLAPTAVERGEWLAGQEGMGLLRKLLLELMIETNGISKAQRGGVKRLNPYLTGEQRAAVEAIQPPGPDRESFIAANQALARLFIPLAKQTLARAGAPWPQALEDATRRHLTRTFGAPPWD